MLVRLQEAEPGAWRHDPEAANLMRFTADRYAALAHKHGQTPEDAAVAAFEVMLNDATRRSRDPWAVVTWAVRITLIANERAHGLLTSTERARRPEYSIFHDAARFSDYESDLTEYHPAFQVSPATAETDLADDFAGATTDAAHAVDGSITLLVLLGWEEDAARTGVDYICSRLVDAGDRIAAYEMLRRDKTARALLDLPHESWIGLLRVVLGHPGASTVDGRRGTLVRLLIGEPITDLLGDDDFVLSAVMANPQHRRPR